MFRWFLADSIVSLGKRYLGVPYGDGTIDSTGKFNCASFTDYIYSKHGIPLPCGARNQALLGMEVSRNELRIGDLLFFSTAKTRKYRGIKKIGHVGIYIGKDHENIDLILHTYGKPGVVISRMNDGSWWNKHFITARRIFAQGLIVIKALLPMIGERSAFFCNLILQ